LGRWGIGFSDTALYLLDLSIDEVVNLCYFNDKLSIFFVVLGTRPLGLFQLFPTLRRDVGHVVLLGKRRPLEYRICPCALDTKIDPRGVPWGIKSRCI
jgi:hypothetical protein